MHIIFITFAVFFFVRLISLFISIKNEKRLKKQGAIEYGKLNSALLTICHILLYASALYEAWVNKADFNMYSQIGTGILIFSYTMLFYVIYELREVWTVKLYIAPTHKVIKSFLFRTVRHPNYFLNVIPEIFGVVLLCNAWKTLLFVIPPYLVILAIRIYQEERVMKGML